MASILTRFLIWAIEGLNRVVGYFEHDMRRGTGRKTMATAIILVAVVGFSFVGSSITGQVIRAQDTAEELASKLGTVEAEYQQLSVDYDRCKTYRDAHLDNLTICRTDLSVSDDKLARCNSDYSALKPQYDSCASNLSSTHSAYTALTSNHNTLTTNYNNLVAKNNAIVINAVIKFCCKLSNQPSVNYQLTDTNEINCFVEDAVKTGTVTCP